MFGLMCAIFFELKLAALKHWKQKHLCSSVECKMNAPIHIGKTIESDTYFNFILSGSIVSFWHISALSVDSTKAIHSNANKLLNVPIFRGLEIHFH